MTSPSEKHMEAARQLIADYGSDVEGLLVGATAAALANAEREGMRRAAEIVRSHVPFMPPDGPINAAHQAEYEALGFAMQAIISEIGDHP